MRCLQMFIPSMEINRKVLPQKMNMNQLESGKTSFDSNIHLLTFVFVLVKPH